jgi:hypothetical protein
MRKAAVLGLAAFCSSGTVLAQTTNCMDLGGGMVHCDTIGSGGSASTNCMGMGQMATCQTTQSRTGGYSDSGTALGQGLGQFISSIRERSIRARIGKLLSDGDCAGAYRYALEKGRLELGQAIQRSCAPAATPKSPPTTAVANSPAAPLDVEGVVARAASLAKVPSPIGHGFTVTRVEAVGKQLLLTAVSDGSAPFDADVRREMINETCAQGNFAPYLRAGATIRTVYLDGAGTQLGAVLVTAQECGA